MITEQGFVQKPLESFTAVQWVYGASVEDFVDWLNDGQELGYTGEIAGWKGTLSVKLNNVEVLSVDPSQWLARSGTGGVHKLTNDLLSMLWQPAV
jgi:hypothetical protein